MLFHHSLVGNNICLNNSKVNLGGQNVEPMLTVKGTRKKKGKGVIQELGEAKTV